MTALKLQKGDKVKNNEEWEDSPGCLRMVPRISLSQIYVVIINDGKDVGEPRIYAVGTSSKEEAMRKAAAQENRSLITIKFKQFSETILWPINETLPNKEKQEEILFAMDDLDYCGLVFKHVELCTII